MRLLIIGQTPPPYGGQIIHIGKIVSLLNEEKLDFKLVRMNFSEEMDETGKFSLKKVWKLIVLQFVILKNVIFYRPDFVYYPPSGCEKVPVYRDILMLFFIRLFKIKTIFHFHAGGISELYDSLNPVIKKAFKYAFFNPEHSICMSQTGLKDPIFLESKQNTIIPYGVEDISKQAKKTRSKIFQVLFVGVCRESKGILDFIEIIKVANSVDKRVIGRIVGKAFSMKEETAIKEAVNLGIVIYDGVKIGDEKRKIFCESDVFLFPTFFEHENFPTVNLEAFSAGLPVVSTNWRGVLNQISNGRNGYRYDVHDIQGMSDAILKLLNDEELYAELSRNARQDYEAYYSDETFKKNILNFFNSLK
ncbi:glycosyltransferase [Emticicia sp. CRIBPO]|uniref:glycosyltransferase family 4 protein n=1 Tax=Emticicia sp. CRIBPO TaxID=2683258 RepID=UPI00141354C3|nr:glycosyltransferase family 4 protein [Emticicia sp. CRIBPO]NBA85276.1 glycosyltransferase [Emticicia sp. CRIBPO]